MKKLNPLIVPLSGKILIEASAGTGKTWTIAALYLRLILEREFCVEQILVVTFTNVATEELRQRLRIRLTEAHAAFASGRSSDPYLASLLEKNPDHAAAVRVLLKAIRGFDECAVSTIHGFCQRLLGEAALESGLAFEQELLTDDSDLLQQAADDFWRRRFSHASPALLTLFEQKKITPESLMEDVRNAVAKPYLDILRKDNFSGCDLVYQVFLDSYFTAQQEWREKQEEVAAIFFNDKSLQGRSYSKANVPKWLAWMDAYLSVESPGMLDKDSRNTSGYKTNIERFMASGISVKKDYEPPSHRFFDLWEDFVTAYTSFQICLDDLLNLLRYDLLIHLRESLHQDKKNSGTLTFDDLLLRLHDALHAASEAALVELARQRYPVALIDEFQDTDPIQYGIFRKIYNEPGQTAFFVGDPKQAIYSFRGADVFTYLKARNETDQQFTLSTNYRSAEGVVWAVNSLFNSHARPFWLREMHYQPVDAGNEVASAEPLNKRLGSFRLLTLDAEQELTKDAANDRIAAAIADDISGLLNEAQSAVWTLNERPFNGGDIAVLVRSHKEADQVRSCLNQRGISCVQQLRDSVFHTDQARQLSVFLGAVANVSDEARIRAALATELLGQDARAIAGLKEDIDGWERWLEHFSHWRQLWLQKGFMVMFRRMLQEQKVYPRLLAYIDGERRLTNLLHLAELLNHESMAQTRGMESLLGWLARVRQRKSENDEYILRLESDEHLVNIVTIHASKGLEYGVLYCPFLWNAKDGRKTDAPFFLHNPEKDNRASLELGSAERDDWLKMKQEEDFADDLRLLYVAVTRAKYHCTAVIGNIRSAGSSALAWLLYGRDQHEGNLGLLREPLSEKLAQQVVPPDLDPSIVCEPLPELEQAVGFKQAEPPVLGRPRSFRRTLAAPKVVTSYTGLTSGMEDEMPDYDFGVATPVDDTEIPFRGAQAGSCLHHMLEFLDFSSPVAEQQDIIISALNQFGFEQDLAKFITDWLQDVLDTPLFADSDFSLAHLSANDRLNEMGFFFPVARLDVAELRKILKQTLPTALQAAAKRLEFKSVQGYLNGFIDLIYRREGRYYIADYKSNWLAQHRQDYHAGRMTEAIADEHYYLQYLLYTVALHRYLKLRQPGYDYAHHFGGVQYLFLRGMTPEGSDLHGVYFDRPAWELIEALEGWLEE